MTSKHEKLRQLLREHGYNISDPDTLRAVHEKISATGIDPKDIASLKVTIKDYQMGSKDATGEPQVTDLHSIAVSVVTYSQKGIYIPASTARPTTVKPLAARPRRSHRDKVAVVLPDPQIGYRLIDGKLDPFHDERAMRVALRVMRYLQDEFGIDLVVNLGDFLDFPEHGSFMQETTWQQMTAAALDRAHKFLAEQRAVTNAEIRLLAGNHDKRLRMSTAYRQFPNLGIRQAGSRYPALSVPHLLNTDSLGVTYIDGYPANETWVNENLRCVHGDLARQAGQTARAVVERDRISTIFGHIHRIEIVYKTVNVYGGEKTYLAMSPGCLCRIDGAVPSTKGAARLDGTPVRRFENWQQGLAVVYYQPGNGEFRVENLLIREGSTYYHGQRFDA